MSWYQKAAVLASLFPKRFRITNGAGDDAAVQNTTPTGTEEALVVRNIPSGVQQVTIVSGGGSGTTATNVFNTSLAVASNATATIINYTVPVGKNGFLLTAETSGTNMATYDIIINGSEFARKRTYYGGSINAVFDIGSSPTDGFPLSSGDNILVKVTNSSPISTAADFEARLYLLLM